MWLFGKKKNETQQILENKNAIADMADSVDVLISLAKENSDLVSALTDMQDKIKYFNPSMSDDVLALDKKISNKLGDLKIELNKAKQKGEYEKASELVSEIADNLVVERASKSKRR